MTKDINEVLLRCWKEAIRNLPPAIDEQGGSDALWFACKRVQEMGIPLELAIDLLSTEYNPLCDPPWHEWDLQRTIRRAFKAPVTGIESVPNWPKTDQILRNQIVENVNVKMGELVEMSTAPCVDPDPYHFVDTLFPDGNPLLCIGSGKKLFATMEKTRWQGRLQGKQFMVPSAMSAPTGRPKGESYQSPRTDENTGPRLYQVIECDISEYRKTGEPSEDAPFIRRMAEQGRSIDDINASLIAHLGTKWPLVLAVHSAGKSLHGWFRVKDAPDDAVKSFFRYACQLGADPKLWTPCQPVRLPNGIRDNGKIQHVKYFNPTKI